MMKHLSSLALWLVACFFATSAIAGVESNESDFLEADQAFVLDVSALKGDALTVNFKIAPGYYLYKQRIHAQSGVPEATITRASFPEAQVKNDPNFGRVEIYHDQLQIGYQIKFSAHAPVSAPISLTYQGCSEKGLCYPPITKTIPLANPASEAAGESAKVATASENAVINSAEDVPKDEVSVLLHDGGFFLVIAGFFGFGLLLSLTPCVFPMIPILSTIILGQGSQSSRISSFNLSLAYTMGMALSYTVAGIAAGLTGNLISQALQTPAVIYSSAAVFSLLSLSMCGLYEMKLPGFIESRVLSRTQQMQGGKFLSVFIMGALSALVVSPCVAAPLAGALIYIGQTHDVVLGGVALFFLSLGMGMPLLVIGASAGALLPRAGVWMVTVRNFFGVLMLAMAIWLISSQISVAVQMILWGVLLVVVAIYLGALDAVNTEQSKWPVFWKGMGVAMLFVGFAMFVGALSGGEHLLQPLSGFRPAMDALQADADKSGQLNFKKVRNVDELNHVVQSAAGQFVMLDFYADWCTACKEIEHLTFNHPEVKARLNKLLLVQVDVTQNTPQQQALLKQFRFFGPPGIAFYDPQGNELKLEKVTGFMNSEQFKQRLDHVLASR